MTGDAGDMPAEQAARLARLIGPHLERIRAARPTTPPAVTVPDVAAGGADRGRPLRSTA